jgi:hypothetical protein
MNEGNGRRRPPNFQDLTGQTFGNLKVLEFGETKTMGASRQQRTFWKCVCVCGTIALIASERLKSGKTKSCGCRRWTGDQKRTHGHSVGRKITPEFSSWRKMIERCENPNNRNAPRYKDRGIRVCERWRESFANFFEDMGPRPSAKHSIDRFPNNDGNYEPDNCRWATQQEQMQNMSRNVKIEFCGEVICLAEFLRRTGFSGTTFHRWQRQHGTDGAAKMAIARVLCFDR